MSGRPPLAEWRDAIRDSDLDVTAKAAAWALSTYFTGDGRTGHDRQHPAPSKATLARGISVCKRTLDAAIHRVEIAGYLFVGQSSGRRTNHYEARIPDGDNESRALPRLADSSRTNHANSNAQRCKSRTATVHAAASECSESVESRRSSLDERRRAWLANIGRHYAHDPEDFREEAHEALGIGHREAETLRVQLLADAA